MEKIDLRTFKKRYQATRIGDIVYLPEEPYRCTLPGAQAALLRRLDRLPPQLADDISRCQHPVSTLLSVEANSHLDGGYGAAPPNWFAALPVPIRRAAERSWAIHHVEDPNIALTFPRTGIGGYIIDLDEHGLLGGAYHEFGLGRLVRVRQPAWLNTPVVPEEGPGVIPHRFTHNRLEHVWDVAAIATLLAAGTGLPEEDAAVLILAAATHDARTPAGGDTTKLLDPEFFDEDARYGELLGRRRVAAFLKRFGIDKTRLSLTVRGQGLLGTLLDIADKTAYIARDANVFHWRSGGDVLDCEEGLAIHDLLRAFPEDACSAWQTVRVCGGRAVFGDPEALARLLTIRALIFRALYYHPGARYTEFIVSHLVLAHLIKTGRVKSRTLFTWRDERLDRRVKEFANLSFSDCSFGEPVHEGFDQAAAAERRAQDLRAAGEVSVMIERLPRRIKSGTDFLVPGKNGPRPLRQAHPDLAAPIDALARVVRPFRLYWVPQETLPSRLRDILTPA